LVERREQQRHHQACVDRQHAPDRVVVAWRLAPEGLPEAHSAVTATGQRRRRSSAIADAIPIAPTTSHRFSVSDSSTSANTTEMKGCRFVKRFAREGPTRSIAVYQSRFVRNSGPTIA